jgi:transposase-like protein
MSTKFTLGFKQQAVEKALRRASGVTFHAVADTLGVAHSTLHRWIVEAKNPAFNTAENESAMIKNYEKKPQDWNPEERFNMIVTCAALDKNAVNQRCREQGLYPHHIEQWRHDFLSLAAKNTVKEDALELKKLKQEFSATKKDLQRKNKALAEAAALLVLQKKINVLWGSDEDDSL